MNQGVCKFYNSHKSIQTPRKWESHSKNTVSKKKIPAFAGMTRKMSRIRKRFPLTRE